MIAYDLEVASGDVECLLESYLLNDVNTSLMNDVNTSLMKQ